MLGDRRFRSLDRARLDARDLAHGWPRIESAVVALRAAQAVFAARGEVPPLARACQDLVAALDATFGVPAKRVFLRDRPRPHRRRNGRIVYELHGQCSSDGPIEVYVRTAAHGRPVACKTLLDTLLHEWVHHWDFTRHGASVHCSGFYERLAQLYRPARDRLDALAAQEAARAGPPRAAAPRARRRRVNGSGRDP